MSEEKIENKEKILVKSGFVLGIISIIITFVPVINYMSYITGLLAVIFSLVSIWKKNSKQIAYFGLVLGFLSILITYIILIKNIDFAFNKISEVNNKLNINMMNEGNINDTENVLANEVDVIIGTLENEISDYEYDFSYNSIKLPVTLKNKSNEIKSFNITIEAVDENGDRITENTVYVEKLRSGQSYQTTAFDYMSGEMTERLQNATFRVLDASSY